MILTFGIRYSLELPQTEKNNQHVFLDQVSPSPLIGQVPGYTDLRGGVGFVTGRTHFSDRNNWEPRLGLALPLNEKTVVRVGAGIFHHPLVPNTDTAQGFSRMTSAVTAQPDGVTPNYALANPFPQGIRQPPGNRAGLLTNAGLSVSGPVRQQRLPCQSQWSLDIQRQLPWQMVFDVGYAGAAAVALPSGVQFNQIPDIARLGFR